MTKRKINGKKIRLAVLIALNALIWVALIRVKIASAQQSSVATEAITLAELIPLSMGSALLTGIFTQIAKRGFFAFKRVFDFVAACAGLVVLFPLFVIIGILIKIDSSGPLFFRQERAGKDGEIFNIWKFRTMRPGAEIETGPVWAAEDDPRITRIGHFLRKSHLDELPQLINVFKGEMSIIGPCPERPIFIEKINGSIPNYDERLKVRPGITGLAQVRYRYGASIKDAAEKLRYDLLYIKRMCWMLDFKILFSTIGKSLSGEGAR